MYILPVFSPEQTETQDQHEAQLAEVQLTEAQQAQADRAASHADGRPPDADSEFVRRRCDGEQKDRLELGVRAAAGAR